MCQPETGILAGVGHKFLLWWRLKDQCVCLRVGFSCCCSQSRSASLMASKPLIIFKVTYNPCTLTTILLLNCCLRSTTHVQHRGGKEGGMMEEMLCNWGRNGNQTCERILSESLDATKLLRARSTSRDTSWNSLAISLFRKTCHTQSPRM